MAELRSTIAEVLRGRVLRGVQAGTLLPGDRLPSARELVAEFNVDHRLVLASYRRLADEGLVEVRKRGGIYVAAAAARQGGPPLPAGWFVEMLTDAITHEIGAPELSEWLRRATETLRLRAVVLSSTADQVAGLARELRDDFGLAAEGMVASDLENEREIPSVVRHADLLVATAAHMELAQRLGQELHKPVLTIDVRPDLVTGEWALLLRQPVWAIVATSEFGDMLRHFFAKVPGVENLHVLVLGRDDLDVIPDGAPTYVTHRVREQLRAVSLRGRILPPARTISADSTRELLEFIVRANFEALRAMHPASKQMHHSSAS